MQATSKIHISRIQVPKATLKMIPSYWICQKIFPTLSRDPAKGTMIGTPLATITFLNQTYKWQKVTEGSKAARDWEEVWTPMPQFRIC